MWRRKGSESGMASGEQRTIPVPCGYCVRISKLQHRWSMASWNLLYPRGLLKFEQREIVVGSAYWICSSGYGPVVFTGLVVGST